MIPIHLQSKVKIMQLIKNYNYTKYLEMLNIPKTRNNIINNKLKFHKNSSMILYLLLKIHFVTRIILDKYLFFIYFMGGMIYFSTVGHILKYLQ